MFIRRRSETGFHLEWRIRFFGAGAILGVLGIYFEARWMIWLAIAVLVAGFLLRFLRAPPADPYPYEEVDTPRPPEA